MFLSFLDKPQWNYVDESHNAELLTRVPRNEYVGKCNNVYSNPEVDCDSGLSINVPLEETPSVPNYWRQEEDYKSSRRAIINANDELWHNQSQTIQPRRILPWKLQATAVFCSQRGDDLFKLDRFYEVLITGN